MVFEALNTPQCMPLLQTCSSRIRSECKPLTSHDWQTAVTNNEYFSDYSNTMTSSNNQLAAYTKDMSTKSYLKNTQHYFFVTTRNMSTNFI